MLADSERTRYYFDSVAGKYVAAPKDKPATGQARLTTAERFGVVGTNLVRTGVVDAAAVRGDHVYLFSGDEYYRYPKASFGALDAGYPKETQRTPASWTGGRAGTPTAWHRGQRR